MTKKVKIDQSINTLTELLLKLHLQKDEIAKAENVSPALIANVDKSLHELLKLLKEPTEFGN